MSSRCFHQRSCISYLLVAALTLIILVSTAAAKSTQDSGSVLSAGSGEETLATSIDPVSESGAGEGALVPDAKTRRDSVHATRSNLAVRSGQSGFLETASKSFTNFAAANSSVAKASSLSSVYVLDSSSCPQNLTGAIFTTDSQGVPVNQNIYQDKKDVYLMGGPRCDSDNDDNDDENDVELPPGEYVFQVTEPDGTLLSSDAISKRRFTVDDDGNITAVNNHNTGDSSCGGRTVQLAPYADSKNGEYKVWVVPSACYQGSGGGKNGFDPNKSKTDNFRVRGKEEEKPSLKIDKKVNGKEWVEAAPRDIVTFTLLVSNLAPGKATNVTVEDSLPGGLIFVDGSSSSSCARLTSSSSTLEWTIAELGAGQSCLITFEAKVDPGLSEKDCDRDLVNKATASVTSGGDHLATEGCDDGESGSSCDAATDTATVRVKCQPKVPDLMITKAAKVLDKPLRADSWIEYTLTVKNTGEEAAENAIVTDAIDGLTRLDTDSIEISCDKGSTGKDDGSTPSMLKVLLEEVEHGETCTIRFKVQVKESAKCGDVIRNTANVEVGPVDPLSNETRLTVECTPPKLDVEKSSEVLRPLRPGSFIKYTITLKNTAEADAENVDVVDTIPALTENISEVSVKCTKGSAGLWSWAGATFTVHFDTVKAGETCTIMFKVQVRDTAKCDDVIRNRVVAKLKGAVADEAEDRLTVECKPPELHIVKAAKVVDKPLRAGSWIEYTLTVKNTGEQTAENAVVTDDIDGLTKLDTGSIQISCDKQSTGKDDGSTPSKLQVLLKEVKAGETCTIRFKVQVKESAKCGDVIRNTANVEAGPVDPLSNETRLTVECTPAKLDVEKSSEVQRPLRPGSFIKYTITLKNTGETDAENVDVVDTIHALTQNISEVSIKCSKGSAGSWEWDASVLRVHFAKVLGGETCTIMFKVQVSDRAGCDDEIVNRVVVKQKGQVEDQAEDHLRIECKPADLKASKKFRVLDAPVKPGSRIEYTITVKNVGERSAQNVSVTDAIDPLTTLKTSSLVITCDKGSQGQDDGSTPSMLRVRLTTVKGGETCTIKFLVKVTEKAQCVNVIRNKAQVQGGTQFIQTNETVIRVFCPPYQIIGEIDLGKDPIMGAVNPVTHEAVITTGLENRVVILDLINQQVLASVEVDSPHGVAINPTTNEAIITSLWSNTVSILNLTTRQVVAVVSDRVGPTPRGVAVNPLTNTAVVANNGGVGSVSVIDLTQRKVTARITVGYGPDSVAINPVTNRAAVTNNLDGSVSLINLNNGTVEATITTGNNPLGVAFNADTNLLYVVNQGDATLSTIDPVNRTLLGPISVGDERSMPDQVDIDSDTNRAVVSNFNDHAVVFLDLSNGQILAKVDMQAAGGRGPRGVAIDPVLGLVLVVHQQSNTLVLVSM